MESTDLRAALYFTAAVRVAADSSLTRLLPLELQKEPLSPHEKLSQRMLFSLQALGMIEPELSLVNVEDWLTARGWGEIGLGTLAWRIRWTKQDCRERTALASELLRRIEPSESALDALLGIWEDLALAEVLRYAGWTLAKSGCNPHWAECAISNLREALRTFSITQVMYLIQLAMRSLASTHQRGGVSSSQLGEVFADSLSYFTRRAKLEKWAIREVARPTQLPISAIAVVFAAEATRLNDDYVTRAPSKAALLDAMTRARAVH
ncbi:hypothetical protein [Rudaea cellulosilytica]|uniref:hypothetical protein n=1 Tax=Rudaea cellulosilytica TaxID=540746 RepID=UPI00035F670E|nr:hypothetical protein [Rudaea cellulosilytica]